MSRGHPYCRSGPDRAACRGPNEPCLNDRRVSGRAGGDAIRVAGSSISVISSHTLSILALSQFRATHDGRLSTDPAVTHTGDGDDHNSDQGDGQEDGHVVVEHVEVGSVVLPWQLEVVSMKGSRGRIDMGG